MDGRRFSTTTLLAAALIGTSVFTAGCVGLITQLGYLSGGSVVTAAYPDLQEKRVAVVCVSDSESYGSGGESEAISRLVSSMLAANVSDIDVVPFAEVADWDDKNDWDEIDYRDVGRGVKAERVVAIDLVGLRFHEGTALYKGRADVTVTVLDMTRDGREVYQQSLPDVVYPVNGYYHTTETPEGKFRRAFLRVVARQIARHFFDYDALNEFGPDPASISRL
jgi:hypothetical protein